MKWHVSLNNNSFERAGITKDCKDAICEYIWNGFEANATKVSVSITGQSFDGVPLLAITDNGDGISFENLAETFGAFLSSVKNNSSIRIKSQTNKGKGRFSYLSFSYSAEWNTVYNSNGTLKRYTIKTETGDRSQFDTSEPVEAEKGANTGTTVVFPLIESSSSSQLSIANMQHKLLEEFAWFLFLNKEKGTTLEYMGIPLDYTQYINFTLSKRATEKIDGNDFYIQLIVWNSNVANSSKIFYRDDNGLILAAENTSFNKNKVNFYHAVFVTSKYFNSGPFFPLSEVETTQEELEIQPSQRKVFSQIRKKIASLVNTALKSFLVIQADERLSYMEQRGNFPSFAADEYGQLRKKDFERVTRELYCIEPNIFYKLNDTQEKSLLGFLNLLLSSDERESVLTIVEQIVTLTPEQRKRFAETLKRTRLQFIAEAIGIIEKRAAIIEALKKIVFDYSSFANERDHIQQLIEQHFWLFGEQYHLLTADRNLRKSLQEFEKITDHPQTDADKVSLSEKELLQRIDIFLYSQRIQENNCTEMLIIELKAPSVKLTTDVFNQIVRYANTIRKEPRFNSGNRVWRFIAVCREVEDDVRIKYNNFKQYGKNGLADIIGNFEVYALSWDDIFQSFEARNSFLLEKLKLDYSEASVQLGFDFPKPKSKEEVTAITKAITSVF